MAKRKGIMGDIAISAKDMQEALKANADGAVSYIGLNDDCLNFGEAQSFVDEGDSNKEFTLNLVNGTAAKQKIQFNEIIAAISGYTVLAEGEFITVGTGESATHVTCEGDPRSFDLLAALIKKTPMRLLSIKFNVSDASQLDEVLKYQKETPFETGKTAQVIPSTKQDQNTQNTKMVEVDLNDWVLGYNSTILYTLRAGVSVSMTLKFGASFDPDHALHAKFAAAKATAARYYASQNA